MAQDTRDVWTSLKIGMYFCGMRSMKAGKEIVPWGCGRRENMG